MKNKYCSLVPVILKVSVRFLKTPKVFQKHLKMVRARRKAVHKPNQRPHFAPNHKAFSRTVTLNLGKKKWKHNFQHILTVSGWILKDPITGYKL